MNDAPHPVYGRLDRPLDEINAPTDPVPSILAATVILVRDTTAGVETLMLRRNSQLAFIGGMWVFPGGRVDAGDRDPGQPDDDDLAARRAAAREAKEEADLDVSADDMVPMWHWLPPEGAVKRFATHFFVARAPIGEVTIDMGEIHDHIWITAQGALAKHDAGEIEMAPPTWMTLRRLTFSNTVDEVLAEAASAPYEYFVTRIAKNERGVLAIWHGDAGYVDGNTEAEGPRHRLHMIKGGWIYERA